MKKIIIVIGHLRIGGVAKALIELLRNIENKYDITLLCFDHEGSLFSDIPQHVKILPTNHLLELTERSASQMKQAGIIYFFLRYVFAFITKIISKKLATTIFVHMIGKINGAYDLAISYTHPMLDSQFCNLGGEVVLNCINAKKKAVFIHCDFSSYGGNTKYNRWLLRQFDKIAVVSDSVGKAVVSCIPDVKDKVITIRNCHDYDTIKKMAYDMPVIYNQDIIFVTIARLSKEKGITRCIPAFVELHNSGKKVEWIIVGDGPMKQQIIEMIEKQNAEDYIMLVGEHNNSYRYLVNADYLLLPSYHEAAPMVYDEAACLGVPIISTELLSAKELVTDRKIGIVCDNSDEGIKRALLEAVDAPHKRIEIHLSNEEAISSFHSLCDE